MAVSHDLRSQLEKIDLQILDLLEQRVSLCQELLEEDEDAVTPEYQADMLAAWEEAADERGWSLGALMKVWKGIVDLCKTMAE